MPLAQLWNNLVAYALQVGLLVALGAIIPPVLKLRTPRARLLFWQAILASCVLSPWIQPWRQEVINVSSITAIETIEATQEVAAAPSLSSSGGRTNRPVRQIPFTAVLLCIFAAGVVVRIGLLIVGLVRLAGYRRRGRELASDPVFRIATPTTARWLVSEEIASPVTFGWRDPVVVLPVRFPSLRPELREAILCHELIHIERRDWMYTVAEELARAIFWFHPAVWWVLGEIQLAREQAVDQAVVEITGAREQYVDALLTMAAPPPTTSESQLDLAPAPLFLRRRHLKHRVVELLRGISPVSRAGSIAALATAMAAIATACWFVSGAFPFNAAPQLVADSAGVVVNTGDAKLLYRTPVLYPEEAIEKGVQGTVVIDAVVEPDDTLSADTVVHCLRELCDAVSDSLPNWRFAYKKTRPQKIFIDFLRPPGARAIPVDDLEQDEFWVSRMLAQQLSKPKCGAGNPACGLAFQPKQSSAARPNTVVAFNAATLVLDGAYVWTLAATQAYGRTLNSVRIAGLTDSTSQLLSRLPVKPGDIWSPANAGIVNQVVKDFAPGLEASIIEDPASKLCTLWIGPSFPAPGPRVASYADVTPPALIAKTDPEYTDSARAAGTSGTVALAITVGPDGRAQDARVITPLDPALDASAMSVVSRWRFKPGRKNGAPIAVPAQINFTFRIL